MIFKNKYLNDINTLFSASVLAAITPILVSPILTRQYSPEDFGAFAFFIAITDILLVLATFQFASAIVIPKKDSKAINLLAVSVAITAIVSTCALALAAIVYWLNIGNFGGAIIHNHLIFIPLLIFFSALYTTLYLWQNRMGRYKTISAARIASVSSIALISVLFGLITFGAMGLILAVIIGKCIGVIFLFYKLMINDWRLLKKIKFKQMLGVAVENKNFPIFTVPAGLFNMFSWQVPAIMFKIFFSISVLGFYDLCHRVLAAPTSLVGTAVQDVFKVRASKDYAEQGSCKKIYIYTLLYLTIVATALFLPLYLFAPGLFKIVFGANWGVAGEYAQVLIPYLAIRFIAGPLGYILYIANKQHIDLIWQSLLSVALFSSIYYGCQSGDPTVALTYLSYSGASLYFVYIVLLYYYSSNRVVVKSD